MTSIKALYESANHKSQVSELVPASIQQARDAIEHIGVATNAIFIRAADAKLFDSAEVASRLEKGEEKAIDAWYDPVHEKSFIEKGYLGVLLGMYVFSDYKFPKEKQFITGNFVANINDTVAFQDLEV